MMMACRLAMAISKSGEAGVVRRFGAAASSCTRFLMPLLTNTGATELPFVMASKAPLKKKLSMVRRFSMVLQSESDARAGQWVENMRRQGAGRGCARTQLVDCDSLSARVALRVVGRSVVRCGFLCRRFFRYSFLHASTKCIMEVGILLRASARWVLTPERARTSHPTSRVWRRAVHPICWEAVTPAYSFWLKACGLEPYN